MVWRKSRHTTRTCFIYRFWETDVWIYVLIWSQSMVFKWHSPEILENSGLSKNDKFPRRATGQLRGPIVNAVPAQEQNKTPVKRATRDASVTGAGALPQGRRWHAQRTPHHTLHPTTTYDLHLTPHSTPHHHRADGTIGTHCSFYTKTHKYLICDIATLLFYLYNSSESTGVNCTLRYRARDSITSK